MSRTPRLDAAIFDVDGVLVASPHERAWREALAALVASRWGGDGSGIYAPERFTTAVYQEHVAGKARLAGARAVLDHFAMPAVEARTAEYARAKQSRLDALIDAGEFVAFPDALRLIAALRARGLRLAAASSSKNANRFMARIRLDAFVRDDGRPTTSVAPGEALIDVFAANVSGRDLPRGKPSPHIFLLAAEELGALPASCVVVEDAPAGVQAAKAAGMAALGIARLDDAPLLEEAGADLVVASLDEVDVDALAEGRLARLATASGAARRGELVAEQEQFTEQVAAVMEPSPDPAWLLRQEGSSPLEETGIESRFSIANGFLGVRGARAISRGPMWMSFLHTLSWASWPRTFVAGLFDTPNTEPPVPALAPAPDWLRVRLMLDDEPLLLRSGELLAHSRTLDMRRGVMLTEWHQRDPKGRVIRIRALRMVSMADRPSAAARAAPRTRCRRRSLNRARGYELGLEPRASRPASPSGGQQAGKCLAMAGAGSCAATGTSPAGARRPAQREWRWTSTPGRRSHSGASSPSPGRRQSRARAAARVLGRAASGRQDVLGAHVDAWAERGEQRRDDSGTTRRRRRSVSRRTT
jgi:beta-phosphoglucomutase-like phosphatase (HAD superfamily)